MADVLKAEMSCAYAALILADDGLAVTKEKLQAILKAANVNIEPVWAEMFAGALSSCDIKSLVTAMESAGAGGVAAVAPAGDSAAAAPAAAAAADTKAKKEEKKEESESDEDMGFGLFD